MERSEPTFVPEWYKGVSSCAASSRSLKQHNGSLSLSDKNSSFRRTMSSNGSMGREKDFSSRSYSCFGRSHHDRDRDREKGNGFSDYPDPLASSKTENDSLRHSQSMASGRQVDLWSKGTEHDLSNGLKHSAVILVSGTNKSSFEKNFPSLGAVEAHVDSDIAIEKLPIHNLSVNTSTINGCHGWTSALAEVPPILCRHGLVVSSFRQTSPTLLSPASSTSTGLNMAKTLVQAPVRAQIPNDSPKIEELHHQQILKLIPVTPSMSKNLGFNLSKKSKTEGASTVDLIALKVARQSSPLIINNSLCSNVRNDAPKTSQPGFLVLNRKKNGLLPTGKDSVNSRNDGRVVSTHAGISPAATPKGPICLKLNVDGRGSSLAQSSFREKRPISWVQNRNEFFNSLRKKASPSQINMNQEPSFNISSSNSEKLSEQVALDSAFVEVNDVASSTSSSKPRVENGNCSHRGCESSEDPEKLVFDEEEAAFLRSLGWEENAEEEFLTTEEIESFLSKYEKCMLASKQNIAGYLAKLTLSTDKEVEASFC